MTWRMVSRRSIRNIQFGLLIVSTFWGLDYLLPPTEDGKILNYIEMHSFLPLQAWGALMFVVGVVAIIAESFLARNERRYWRLWIVSWTTHAIFASIYIMLAFGSFVSAPLQAEGFAGFRTPILWTFVAALHTAYARRLDKPIDTSSIILPGEEVENGS